MEEEELLFLGKECHLSLKEGRTLELQKQVTELLPLLTESSGKFSPFFGQACCLNLSFLYLGGRGRKVRSLGHSQLKQEPAQATSDLSKN